MRDGINVLVLPWGASRGVTVGYLLAAYLRDGAPSPISGDMTACARLAIGPEDYS